MNNNSTLLRKIANTPWEYHENVCKALGSTGVIPVNYQLPICVFYFSYRQMFLRVRKYILGVIVLRKDGNTGI
jgi:hypothetical protein